MQRKRLYLSQEQREFIVRQVENGLTHDSIAKLFKSIFHRKIHKTTVGKVYTRYLNRRTCKDADKLRRPPIYHTREKRILRREALKRPEESIRDQGQYYQSSWS